MRGDEQRRKLSTYVRERIREEVRPYGAKSELARKLGCSPTHVTELLKGTGDPGERFLRSIAAHWGTTLGGLEAMAGVAVVPGDPYPNRTAALALAAEMPWPREALEEVRREAPATDPPIAWWIVRAWLVVQRLQPYDAIAPPAKQAG